MNKQTIGRYAFIAGLVISVVAGFVNLGVYGLPALVVLGIIVGFLNVTGEEVQKFLLGTIALMLVGQGLHPLMATVPMMPPMVPAILAAFVSFVAGAALIVALKEVYTITKSK